MLFNSIDFIIFFPIVLALYFLIPNKWRWLILLIASYYFYMSWKSEYVVLIIISTLIDYFTNADHLNYKGANIFSKKIVEDLQSFKN